MNNLNIGLNFFFKILCQKFRRVLIADVLRSRKVKKTIGSAITKGSYMEYKITRILIIPFLVVYVGLDVPW